MARDLYDNNVDDFWKGVKKVTQCNSTMANSIDGISGESNIANYWKAHYCKLLNSNVCDTQLKSNILGTLGGIQHDENMVVSVKDVSDIICKLEIGKAAGPDGICSESLKYAHDRLRVLLSLCFTLCLSHGHLPSQLIETTIVPIVKNKSN